LYRTRGRISTRFPAPRKKKKTGSPGPVSVSGEKALPLQRDGHDQNEQPPDQHTHFPYLLSSSRYLFFRHTHATKQDDEKTAHRQK
jgi:hypothetical protein